MTNGAPPTEGRRLPVPAALTSSDSRDLRLFGLISLLLAITFAPAGVITAIIALVRSRRVGYRNRLALAGLIYGLAVTVFVIIAAALALWWGVAIFGPAFETCRDLGRGIWEIDGVIYRCNI